MTIIYAVVQQFGCISNGNVGSATVPKYSLSFFSTKELADNFVAEVGNDVLIKEVILDDYIWQIVIDPMEGIS